MRLLLAALLIGCSPQPPGVDEAPVVTAQGSSFDARAAAPRLLHWVGGDTAELRAGAETLARLDVATGYTPYSGLSADGQTLATVAVPPGALGHPHRARLLEGPLEGPWTTRSEDALRMQRPVYSGDLYWIRWDGRSDGALLLTALRGDDALLSGEVAWLQWILADPPLLYRLDADGQASVHSFGTAPSSITLGVGQGRDFAIDGGVLWLHWQARGQDATLRRIDLATGAESSTPAPGFGQRSFVLVGGAPVWSGGGRFPEVATEAGILWREPGGDWSVDGVPLPGEGVSWVGVLR